MLNRVPKVGDRVVLESGGPVMTVEQVHGSILSTTADAPPLLDVCWFAGDDVRREGFPWLAVRYASWWER